jgi:hypothetical protein
LEASESLDRAVEGLRRASAGDLLPEGLLAHAMLRRFHGDFAGATADLDETLEIAQRSAMRLHACDAQLERARLLRDQGKADEASRPLAQARTLVEETGYLRREREVRYLERVLQQRESLAAFFISYHPADREWASWMGSTLEAAGYQVLLAAWDFRPGSNLAVEMQRAASRARRTILILSRSSLESDFVVREWETSLRMDSDGRQRRLIPIRVEEVSLRGLLLCGPGSSRAFFSSHLFLSRPMAEDQGRRSRRSVPLILSLEAGYAGKRRNQRTSRGPGGLVVSSGRGGENPLDSLLSVLAEGQSPDARIRRRAKESGNLRGGPSGTRL